MVVEGKGSYGIVVSSPRIPLDNENYDDIKNLNQVSKILYSVENNYYIPPSLEEITFAYENLILLIKSYPKVFNDNNFMLPITGGYINKLEFVEYYKNTKTEYGFDWLSKSSTNLNILNQLISHKDKIFQIVYEKGTIINYKFNDFIIGINNVLQTLVNCNENGFYLDDIKYLNLIIHNERIKIIDWDEPINLNLEPLEYTRMICDSKLHCVVYFPYDTISNILLFEYIGKIKKIGKLVNYNYHNLILDNSYEYSENVIYKNEMFNKLTNLWNEYLPNFSFDLKIIDLEDGIKYRSIQINLKIFDESIKLLFEEYFINSSNDCFWKYDNVNNNFETINKIFDLNKKFIELTKNNFKDKISHLLTNTSIYSFGFVFLDWCKINTNIIIKSENVEKILSKIIKIIVICCLNNVLIDENIYLVERNYLDIEKILNE